MAYDESRCRTEMCEGDSSNTSTLHEVGWGGMKKCLYLHVVGSLLVHQFAHVRVQVRHIDLVPGAVDDLVRLHTPAIGEVHLASVNPLQRVNTQV